jgi:hypothetical protein
MACRRIRGTRPEFARFNKLVHAWAQRHDRAAHGAQYAEVACDPWAEHSDLIKEVVSTATDHEKVGRSINVLQIQVLEFVPANFNDFDRATKSLI